MPENFIRCAYLCGCSDGISPENQMPKTVQNFLQKQFGITSTIASTLCCSHDGKTTLPQARAETLHKAFSDPEVDAIFDLSGGDAANAVLEHLDFNLICHNPKAFFGYSDLSVLLNPLADAGCPVFYFQARFLAESHASRMHLNAVLTQKAVCPITDYRFLQGSKLHGKLVGGNIRCTLKLVGTPWQPDFRDKIIFLESFSGGLSRMETMLWQYRHIGAFRQCRGILLGNFTELSQKQQLEELYRMVQKIVSDPALPIAATTQVGHQPDSICLAYHVPLSLHREETNR